MEIGPILRSLLRNKLGALLIALQIAFTMTVIINAVFIINPVFFISRRSVLVMTSMRSWWRPMIWPCCGRPLA